VEEELDNTTSRNITTAKQQRRLTLHPAVVVPHGLLKAAKVVRKRLSLSEHVGVAHVGGVNLRAVASSAQPGEVLQQQQQQQQQYVQR
jgi:hypothetical protein